MLLLWNCIFFLVSLAASLLSLGEPVRVPVLKSDSEESTDECVAELNELQQRSRLQRPNPEPDFLPSHLPTPARPAEESLHN